MARSLPLVFFLYAWVMACDYYAERRVLHRPWKVRAFPVRAGVGLHSKAVQWCDC